MRPYADTMLELMAGIGRASASVRGLPLLQRRATVQTVAIVPLTGDRGLAGAFNAQILRRAFALERELRAEGVDVRWLAVGKKGRSTLRFRRYELDRLSTRLQRPARLRRRAGDRAPRSPSSTSTARSTASCSSTTASCRRSTQRVDRRRTCCRSPRTSSRPTRRSAPRTRLRGDFIFEPEPEEILERLLPVYLETRDLPRAARVGGVRAGRAR